MVRSTKKGEVLSWEEKYRVVQERQKLLKKVTTELLSTLNIAEAVQKIAGFVVPYVGDFCHISLVNEDNKLEEVLTHHMNEHNARLLMKLGELHEKFSITMGNLNVIRTGKQEYVPDNAVALEKMKKLFPQVYSYAAELNAKSYLAVPITVREKTAGAIAFGSLKIHYTEDELHFAQQLADMIALVMENKQLHREMQEKVVEHKNRELKLTRESEKKWTALAKENAKLYEKAQTAVAMRNTFISIASHELRTPITSVKMYSQFLKRLYERSQKKGVLDYFDRMDTQVNKMSSLLGDLLDVSRIERGKLDYEMGSFSLDEVVRKVVSTVQEQNTKHSIIVEGKIGKNVYGDQERIRDVMMHLLRNAVQYSPEADTVIVTLIAREKKAMITIRDFGIGIDAKHFDLIFKPFQQVTNGTGVGSAGMGTGLYVANAIVKHHGGKIMVESEKGKGSIFRFSLPYAKL